MITNLKKIKRNPFIIPTYAEVCKRDFFKFVQMFWDTIISETPVYNWHIPYLCKELEIVAHRVFKRLPKLYDLIINIPPGTTKTTVCTILFTTWCWTNDESLRFIHGSHSMPLSMENTDKMRDVVESEKYKLLYPHIRLHETKNTKSNFSNTKNGQVVACSVGGKITGKHAHIIMIDDGQDPEGALSDTIRDKANRWHDKTLSSRKVDKKMTPVVDIQQRLHVNDLTGYQLAKRDKGKEIRLLCLPSEIVEGSKVSPVELAEKYIDGKLDIVRLDDETLKQAKIDLGTYGYNEQFLQDPKALGSGMIKAHWFGKFNLTSLELKAVNYNFDLVWNFAVDTAYTENTGNDPTGIISFAIFQNNLYIRNVSCKWEGFLDMIKSIETFALNNGYTDQSMIYIEPKASGISACQTIQQTLTLNCTVSENPEGSKVQRTINNLAFMESCRVYLLEDAGFVEPYIEELTIFPRGQRGDHDERVDCTNIAINKVKNQNINTFSVGCA